MHDDVVDIDRQNEQALVEIDPGRRLMERLPRGDAGSLGPFLDGRNLLPMFHMTEAERCFGGMDCRDPAVAMCRSEGGGIAVVLMDFPAKAALFVLLRSGRDHFFWSLIGLTINFLLENCQS